MCHLHSKSFVHTNIKYFIKLLPVNELTPMIIMKHAPFAVLIHYCFHFFIANLPAEFGEGVSDVLLTKLPGLFHVKSVK